MPLYQAIVLAIVQGLTEFLPISSTAHLALFPWLLGWKDPGLTFDVALHAGTLFAVLVYFRREWISMFRALLGRNDPVGPEVTAQNRRLFWYVFLGTIPAGLAGFMFEDAAESTLRHPLLIGAALVLIGLVMWAGDRLRTHRNDMAHVGLVDALIIGVAQACAVIPGVSRSGATMTAGLFRGLTRDVAARFSFLLSTPIIGGAALKKAWEIHHEGIPSEIVLPFVVGIVVAAIVGYLAIAGLIRYLERRTFGVFVIYRIGLGMLVLALGWGLHHHLG